MCFAEYQTCKMIVVLKRGSDKKKTIVLLTVEKMIKKKLCISPAASPNKMYIWLGKFNFTFESESVQAAVGYIIPNMIYSLPKKYITFDFFSLDCYHSKNYIETVLYFTSTSMTIQK